MGGGRGVGGAYLCGVSQAGPCVRACVGLGANLGDRSATVARAIAMLGDEPGVRVEAVSSLHETDAVTLDGAGGQPRYLNGAAVVETTLSARELLAALLRIERPLGREREREGRWGARTIDLDLLLYGDAVIEEGGLRVPHPRMHERAFVLAPLAEVAPEAVHPVRGETVREMLARLSRG